MKSILNRKFVVLSAMLLTFLMPISAFAADDPAAVGGGSGWVVTLLMILIFFVLGVAILAMGLGLAAAMIGYKLGKED